LSVIFIILKCYFIDNELKATTSSQAALLDDLWNKLVPSCSAAWKELAKIFHRKKEKNVAQKKYKNARNYKKDQECLK